MEDRTTNLAAKGPSRATDAGASTLELVLLVPLIVAGILLVVAMGRISYGRQLVDAASASAARSASLASNPNQAVTQARQSAEDTVHQAGLSCSRMNVDVDVSAFKAGGQVVVIVRCRADLSGLSLPGLPGTVAMTSSSTSPLETYRSFSPGVTQ